MIEEIYIYKEVQHARRYFYESEACASLRCRFELPPLPRYEKDIYDSFAFLRFSFSFSFSSPQRWYKSICFLYYMRRRHVFIHMIFTLLRAHAAAIKPAALFVFFFFKDARGDDYYYDIFTRGYFMRYFFCVVVTLFTLLLRRQTEIFFAMIYKDMICFFFFALFAIRG